MASFQDHYGILSLAASVSSTQAPIVSCLNIKSVKQYLDKLTVDPGFYEMLHFNYNFEPYDLIHEELRKMVFSEI